MSNNLKMPRLSRTLRTKSLGGARLGGHGKKKRRASVQSVRCSSSTSYSSESQAKVTVYSYPATVIEINEAQKSNSAQIVKSLTSIAKLESNLATSARTVATAESATSASSAESATSAPTPAPVPSAESAATVPFAESATPAPFAPTSSTVPSAESAASAAASTTSKHAYKHSMLKKYSHSGIKISQHFIYGIIDHSNAYGKIRQEHQELLKEVFENSLAEVSLRSQIAGTEFIEGIFVISLVSNDYIDKLQRLVENMPELWKGAKLLFVSDIVVPLLTKAAFCISGSAALLSDDEILKIMKRQNPGLVVDLWQIYRRVDINDGVVFVVGLDPGSVAGLQKSREKLFFLTSDIAVRMDYTVLCEYSLRGLERNRVLARNVLRSPRHTGRLFAWVVKDMIVANRESKGSEMERYWNDKLLHESLQFIYKK